MPSITSLEGLCILIALTVLFVPWSIPSKSNIAEVCTQCVAAIVTTVIMWVMMTLSYYGMRIVGVNEVTNCIISMLVIPATIAMLVTKVVK